ncbi:MAG: hypothetical protein EXR74_02985 [Bdellovibrionales bacterium]|nr:hypothetical protein [Bdellovibrionales bacterium]
MNHSQLIFRLIVLFLVSSGAGVRSFSTTLTEEQEKALMGAMEELTDPTKRQGNLKKDKKAAESDELVKEVGGEFSEEIYQLAAKVMETLASDAKGDPEKMEKILDKAAKDPASFAKTFSTDQKKILKQLGKKIERSKKPAIH